MFMFFSFFRLLLSFMFLLSLSLLYVFFKFFYHREYTQTIFFLNTNFLKRMLYTGLIPNYINGIMIHYLHLLPLLLLLVVRHHGDQNEDWSTHWLHLLYRLWLPGCRRQLQQLLNLLIHHWVLTEDLIVDGIWPLSITLDCHHQIQDVNYIGGVHQQMIKWDGDKICRTVVPAM